MNGISDLKEGISVACDQVSLPKGKDCTEEIKQLLGISDATSSTPLEVQFTKEKVVKLESANGLINKELIQENFGIVSNGVQDTRKTLAESGKSQVSVPSSPASPPSSSSPANSYSQHVSLGAPESRTVHIGSNKSAVINSSEYELPEFRPSKKVMDQLEKEHVFWLKKRSIKFPRAKYFCRLCEYHCDTLSVSWKHVNDKRHISLKQSRKLEMTIKNLPHPSNAQIEAVDDLIHDICKEVSLTKEMAEQRITVVKHLETLVQRETPDCRLDVTGSTISGFGLKSSDINIDVTVRNKLNPAKALLTIKAILMREDIYEDVVDELTLSYPHLEFVHKETKTPVVVGIRGSFSQSTNTLLAEYIALDPRVRAVGVVFRHWARVCGIDNQKKGALPAYTFPIMAIHFLQRISPPVVPVLHELHPEPDGQNYIKASELDWQSENRSSVGSLWLKMFKYYAVDVRSHGTIISIRNADPDSKVDKTWSKKIAIEDPFLIKRNMARTISHNLVYDFISTCFQVTFGYFSIPQMQYGPLFEEIQQKEFSEEVIEALRSEVKSKDKNENKVQRGEEGEEEESREENQLSNGSNFDSDVTSDGANTDDELEKDMSSFGIYDVSNDDDVNQPEGNAYWLNINSMYEPMKSVRVSEAAKWVEQVQKEQLHYRFSSEVFTHGCDLPIFCSNCSAKGHTASECEDDAMPPLIRLPPMNDFFAGVISFALEDLKKYIEPKRDELWFRDKIVADLESYIRRWYSKARLTLFGSSANGFGFSGADLDICLTFEGDETGESVDQIRVIEDLHEKLKRYRNTYGVFPITTAKVPIVKFSIKRTNLEGDLSLYNILALRNTNLLSTYASIDYRVRVLGYGLKYFAKMCTICDASRGSLSSYAYMLMVIHFLQQCDPPVVPVLQELYPNSQPTPEFIVDGWNTWFLDDFSQMRERWRPAKTNKKCVGALWAEMFQYYTEKFDWKRNVITIRQHSPLSRLEKLWNTKCIAIEDPFDLSHNLGGGLSRKMNKYIMDALVKGREKFGMPIKDLPHGFNSFFEYLFCVKHFISGSPPNDRGCHYCRRIGHVLNECPLRKIHVEKNDKKKKKQQKESKASKAEDYSAGDTEEALKEDSTNAGSSDVKVTGENAHRELLKALPEDVIKEEECTESVGESVSGAGVIDTGDPTLSGDNVVSAQSVLPPPGFEESSLIQTASSVISSSVKTHDSSVVSITASTLKEKDKVDRNHSTSLSYPYSISPSVLFNMASKVSGQTNVTPCSADAYKSSYGPQVICVTSPGNGSTVSPIHYAASGLNYRHVRPPPGFSSLAAYQRAMLEHSSNQHKYMAPVYTQPMPGTNPRFSGMNCLPPLRMLPIPHPPGGVVYPGAPQVYPASSGPSNPTVSFYHPSSNPEFHSAYYKQIQAVPSLLDEKHMIPHQTGPRMARQGMPLPSVPQPPPGFAAPQPNAAAGHAQSSSMRLHLDHPLAQYNVNYPSGNQVTLGSSGTFHPEFGPPIPPVGQHMPEVVPGYYCQDVYAGGLPQYLPGHQAAMYPGIPSNSRVGPPLHHPPTDQGTPYAMPESGTYMGSKERADALHHMMPC